MVDEPEDGLEQEPTPVPIVIVGVGREDRRDAGVGLIAARVLQNEALGDRVEILEAVPGFGLVLALEGRQRALVIVAAHMGREPGTPRLFAPDQWDTELCEPVVSLGPLSLMDLLEVGGMAQQLPPVWILAVEPEEVAPGTGLTVTVGQALPDVVKHVQAWLEGPQ
jgi:hydrogenase maturation protease